ncbi:MAG: hypothetical protein HFI90_06215 [Clostridia bacterium]|nr:hypothetical protein [Clostridia bacterium]
MAISKMAQKRYKNEINQQKLKKRQKVRFCTAFFLLFVENLYVLRYDDATTKRLSVPIAALAAANKKVK